MLRQLLEQTGQVHGQVQVQAQLRFLMLLFHHLVSLKRLRQLGAFFLVLCFFLIRHHQLMRPMILQIHGLQ
jgi:hypothetical protein